uniref:Uncharacterized protein n=1 Tax=Arundo donax TaxID=35708 RepID=A0A0A9FGI2_ARUDO
MHNSAKGQIKIYESQQALVNFTNMKFSKWLVLHFVTRPV